MLNIAMLSYHTCPLATLGGKDTGGINVYVHELTTSLGKLGVHVDVFTRSQDEHVPHILHDLGYGNRIIHIPAGPETPVAKSDLPLYLPQFNEGILQFALKKNIKYDLIHSHYWMSGLSALDLRKEWDVPVIQMFHTLGEMKNRIALSNIEKEPASRILGEKKIISQADCVVVSTLAEQAQIQFLYQTNLKNSAIIPPGVDTSRFYPIPKDEARQYVGVPNESCLLLFVGRIEPLKGIETLLRAIAIMNNFKSQEGCPHYLSIIGGDPTASNSKMNAEMTRLKKISQDLNISDLVLFLGKRDQATLPYYYSAAEVVIVPSHYESFGMVALEAMSCGTPVVASQVGGLAFLIQDGINGFVVPDGEPEHLAEKIQILIENPELRIKLGNQAAIYARSFDWSFNWQPGKGPLHKCIA